MKQDRYNTNHLQLKGKSFLMKIIHTTWPGLLLTVRRRYSTFPSGKSRIPVFIFIVSVLLVFLSACSNLFGDVTPAPSFKVPRLQRSPEILEDPLERAETRVSQILAGMSLDQKLGQLIAVEYLGNNYQNSGLQEMVAQQYVGGIIYQEVNNNFNAPDNTVARDHWKAGFLLYLKYSKDILALSSEGI